MPDILPDMLKGPDREPDKLKIKEAIVVEGRDDTAAVLRAVSAATIETHGFGIKKETYEVMERAYKEQGLIVFTDPDHAGEEIRRKVLERFPKAKQAFLDRKSATKKSDIGIENAEPEAIIAALTKACASVKQEGYEYTPTDLTAAGLTGEGAKEKREALGKTLGIGYANAKGLVNKLNRFGIKKEDFDEAVKKISEGK